MKNYLSADVQVRRGDVLAAWSGIRPLVINPNKKDTQSIARNHIIHVSDSGLVTIGGKIDRISLDIMFGKISFRRKMDNIPANG